MNDGEKGAMIGGSVLFVIIMIIVATAAAAGLVRPTKAPSSCNLQPLVRALLSWQPAPGLLSLCNRLICQRGLSLAFVPRMLCKRNRCFMESDEFA